jgi:hypothetical protein
LGGVDRAGSRRYTPTREKDNACQTQKKAADERVV